MEKREENQNMWDRYRLLSPIRQGKQGGIFLAYDEKLAMKKVVKMLQKDDTEFYSLRRQQFISEICLMKELQHPCLPHISDLILESDRILLVMDYVEGDTLQEYIARYGPQKEETVIQWGIQLAEFFEYLHERNPPVIHRDLKPSNIILHSSGRLVLLDFGIAMTGQGQSGWCQGTEGYAAPEQYRTSGVCDERTDIYGFGRTLLYCLTGENLEILPEKSTPFNNDISYDFRRVLSRCICSQKEGRFPNMAEVKNELVKLSDSQQNSELVFRALVGTLLILILFFFMGCSFRTEMRHREAMSCVDCAVETTETGKMLNLFDQALQNAPQEAGIYEKILEYYLKPQHFSERAIAKTLNLYEKNGALSILKRKNPGYYGVYCYEMGIGFFYGRGGIAGKKESHLWFERSLEYDGDLTDSLKRRAELYEKISGYYQSFLTEGEDPSGEEEARSYERFFNLLVELNQDCIRSLSQKTIEVTLADQKAAFYGAMEVVEEIREHCDRFLQDGIDADTLENEIERTSVMYRLGDEEEKEELRKRTVAARKRIQTMEGYHEKED